MKIVVVSDTHGKHEDLGILRGDVLVHCGDFSLGGKNEAELIKSLDSWFARQQFRHIICTGGNHDFLCQEIYLRGEKVFRNAICLQGEALTIDGIKFWGAPWVPELSTWANYKTERELQVLWAQIPIDTDVLITHTPPQGVLDDNSRGKSCGCPYLRKAITGLRPQLHCFGHVHASAGMLQSEDTLYVNASVVQSNYELARGAIQTDVSYRERT